MSPLPMGILSHKRTRALIWELYAARLDAGTVWVNCSQPLWPNTPFGGWKASGFGKEWGEAGMHEYLRHKTVTKTARGSSFSWNYFSA